MYYSCHVDKHEFGCGFCERKNRDNRHQSINVQCIIGKILYLGTGDRNNNKEINKKLYNISLICAYDPTEEKDDVVKDTFYAELEDV